MLCTLAAEKKMLCLNKCFIISEPSAANYNLFEFFLGISVYFFTFLLKALNN